MLRGRGNAITLLVAAHLAAGALFLSPGYIRPDSVALFAYVRSAVFDGDLAFFNEWAMAGLVRGGVTLFSEVTPVGALSNHWWIGTSLLSSIPYALTRLVSSSRDGFTGLFAVVLAWTNVAFAIACSAIAWKLGETEKPTRRAVALAATMFGTPLFWYTYRFPLGSHVAGALAVALVLVCLFGRVSQERDGLAGLATGIALGLAVSVRLQHFVLGPAVAYAAIRQRRSRSWWVGAVLGGLLGIAPQAIAWTAIYGTPLGPLASGGNLGGTTWMPFQNIALTTVLFSSYHGLFTWSPVIVLAIAGWIRGARSSDAARRVMAVTLLLMFAGEWLANGTFDRYFWGGMSFGGRRFVDLAVPFAIGLAWLATTRAAAAAEIVLSLWSVALMAAAEAGTLSLSRYVSGQGMFESVMSIVKFKPLHSPIGSSELALQSMAAILIVGVVAAIVVWAVRQTGRALVAAALMMLVFTVATAIVAVRTPARATESAARLHINVEASRRAGPLLDQRGLLLDEIAWAEATGRDDRAARTRAEVDEITQVLRSLPR